MARSPIFDNVDPGLLELIQRVSVNYPQYLTNITSAYRAGDPRFHGRGQALDVELVDPKTGQVLNNYQDPSTAAQYQALANAVYQAASPEMQQKLRWGGYFGGGKGKYGALDLMHFDVGGGPQGVGMAGGSWAGGFTPEMMNTWGIQNAGGIGGGQQQGPPMPSAQMNYTPEQRRQAIAAIESAGSGDYNALGVWTGDPKEGRDRAYGRYQMMGKNIPVWSKQVLGREVSTDEFMRDPKIQDAIFDKIFGDYVAKHGERGAASMWFTGSPNFDADKKDALGTTVKSYATRYLEGLGAPLDMGAKYPTQSPAQSPAGSPTGAPLVAKTEEPKDKIAAGFADIAKNVGGMFGGASSSGGGSGQMPIAKAPAPMSTMVEAQPSNILDPQAGEMQRQKLAMAMARLNSGKLWV